MKTILSERNIVVVLFVMVLVTFAFAQEDSKKKIPKMYTGIATESVPRFISLNGNLSGGEESSAAAHR